MHIEGDGFREFIPGETVEIEYEPAHQDTFDFGPLR
jgi:hypothetical protein